MDTAAGLSSYMMAASPETCGQAMEVPEDQPKAESLLAIKERMLDPGAQTSMQEP
jgi:hypothetical protein